ncbi:MAG: FKBP-type peptidyl-prolyl cis-trans isomerase [Myxococcales bacterium]|nr:FKBP-type peptidyl-prolyl cis-trans isomerase [Myxococcales bacterium]
MHKAAVCMALFATLFGCGPKREAEAQPPTSGATPSTVIAVPSPEPEAQTAEATAPARGPSPGTTRSGLRIEDLRVGDGAEATTPSRVSLHYVGTLEDGSVFDSSRARGTPFEVELGRGYMIRGFEEGVPGMRVGGVRRLKIPPELGYGERGVGAKIPPGATLIFEIELLEVK